MRAAEKLIEHIAELQRQREKLLNELVIAIKFEKLQASGKPFYIVRDGYLLAPESNQARILPPKLPNEIASYLMLRRVPSNQVLWIDKETSKKVRSIIAGRLLTQRKNEKSRP